MAKLGESKGAAREIGRKGGFPGPPNKDVSGDFEEKKLIKLYRNRFNMNAADDKLVVRRDLFAVFPET